MRPEEFEELSLSELDRSIGALANRLVKLEDDMAQLSKNYDVVYGVLKKIVGK